VLRIARWEAEARHELRHEARRARRQHRSVKMP
jgi:hypothetical protein